MGGICGNIDIYPLCEIVNCYNTGKVIKNIGDKKTTIYAGNIVGNHEDGIIKNCYYEKNGIEGIGQDVAENCTDDIIEINGSDMKTENMIEKLNKEAKIYYYDKTNINDGYPILEWQYISILKSKSKVEIDEQNLVIKGIKPYTTIEEIMKILQVQFEGLDQSGKMVSDDVIIGTDYKVKVSDEKIYTLIVWGDFTGDGKIGIAELARASRISVQAQQIDWKEQLILDVSGNGKIEVIDLAVLSRLAVN